MAKKRAMAQTDTPTLPDQKFGWSWTLTCTYPNVKVLSVSHHVIITCPIPGNPPAPSRNRPSMFRSVSRQCFCLRCTTWAIKCHLIFLSRDQILVEWSKERDSERDKLRLHKAVSSLIKEAKWRWVCFVICVLLFVCLFLFEEDN